MSPSELVNKALSRKQTEQRYFLPKVLVNKPVLVAFGGLGTGVQLF